ncbi:hypothetical protein AG1IA_03720 [Rhizoctonia solani AG-1 IA]|uniref:T6SS Phospholipase effector Tle1-like catalytic domain-containing protein n=1 Tax=Thanatephorus cucumeris (strain AG1-IA) TaxID=983506 RepID=L8WVZ7_THACA|nr:hypothetical protein AG1IA_03720 [Rhizoctonia solani AG-1 IA]
MCLTSIRSIPRVSCKRGLGGGLLAALSLLLVLRRTPKSFWAHVEFPMLRQLDFLPPFDSRRACRKWLRAAQSGVPSNSPIHPPRILLERIMPNTLPSIRALHNYELFQLKLVHKKKPAIVVAALTQTAINLGVRFDFTRADYQFNISNILGIENGAWTEGTDFDTSIDNISVSLDLSDRENRCLVATIPGSLDKPLRYNLDEVLWLVDYYHPQARETYFRLGLKPKSTPKRSLVLCFDGTSNQFSNRNTNVVKIFELLKKDDPDRQMLWHGEVQCSSVLQSLNPGLQVYNRSLMVTSSSSSLIEVRDINCSDIIQPLNNLQTEIRFTYLDFLAELILPVPWQGWCIVCVFPDHYFTLRWLRYPNPLRSDSYHDITSHSSEHIPFAYEVYASQESSLVMKATPTPKPSLSSQADEKSLGEADSYKLQADIEISEHVVKENVELIGDPPEVPCPNFVPRPEFPLHVSYGALGTEAVFQSNYKDAEAYKQVFCTPVQIDFVAYGFFVNRHALALDEHRANYTPLLWDHSKTIKGQDIREVWFRGEHSDVGGGAPPLLTSAVYKGESDYMYKFSALSNISLRWMVQQCLENPATSSIAFDVLAMKAYRHFRVLEYRHTQDAKELRTHREKVKEAVLMADEQGTILARQKFTKVVQRHRKWLYDRSSIIDKIEIKHNISQAVGLFSLWKILEIAPIKRPRQTKEGQIMSRIPNFGGPRVIYRRNSESEEPVFIHASVIDFMATDKSEYRPKAMWYGYKDDQLPKIESFENNVMPWPKSKDQKDKVVKRMNIRWEPMSWTEWLLDRAQSFGLNFVRLSNMGMFE